jgi:hypothetical protein
MRDELKWEVRKQRALERLGSDDPRCLCCGENDWRCLEFHHLAGKKFGEEGSVVCRNCHRKLTDPQKDHPDALTDSQPLLLDRVAHFLLGLADLLEMLVIVMRRYGGQLIEAAKHCPRPYGMLELTEETSP